MSNPYSPGRRVMSGRRAAPGIYKFASSVSRFLALFSILACHQFCYAGVVGGTQVHVTQILAYPQYVNGDVVIVTDALPTGCEGGLWMSKSDAGFSATYASVLLAYTNKATVRIWYYDNQMWSGSGTPTCKVYVINLI